MRILIISNSEWDDANCFGNSFSNIFGNIEGVEVANIYCRSGMPNTKSCSHFFQITEKMMIKNMFDANNPSGRIVLKPDTGNSGVPDTFSDKQQIFVNYIKSRRWKIFFWIRDFVWLIGGWKSRELNDFVDKFKPQLLFLPIYQLSYINKMALYIKQQQQIPMVGYVSDDEYTLKQFSMSPFYWIDRLIKRIWVKKVIDHCEILYVISDVQKQEYDHCFRKDCKILCKGGIFSGDAPIKEILNSPIQLVYTGNIGAGRFRVLSEIGKALDKINSHNFKAVLHIYSQTPLNNRMKSALQTKQSIELHGGVPFSEITKIQTNADILVHVESFQLQERLLVRHSFSTKIVDYFQSARCIFAVGWSGAASIDYLLKTNAAIVVSDENQIEEKLRSLLEHPELIAEYGKKGWECGKCNHQITKIQDNLYGELLECTKN